MFFHVVVVVHTVDFSIFIFKVECTILFTNKLLEIL